MELTAEQATILDSWEVVPIRVQLRSPFGEVVASWSVRELNGEYGGMGSLGLLMKALNAGELRVPFVVPGADERAPWYFTLEASAGVGQKRWVAPTKE